MGKYIALGVVVATALGAYLYFKNQYNLLMGYCYKFKNVKVNSLTRNESSVEFTIQFTNPSDLNADISAYEIDVYMNGNFISKIASATPIQVPAKQSFDIPFNLAFNTNDVLNFDNLLDAVKAIITPDQFKIGFRGFITASLLGGIIGAKNVPINIDYSLRDILIKATAPASQNSGCAA